MRGLGALRARQQPCICAKQLPFWMSCRCCLVGEEKVEVEVRSRGLPCNSLTNNNNDRKVALRDEVEEVGRGRHPALVVLGWWARRLRRFGLFLRGWNDLRPAQVRHEDVYNLKKFLRLMTLLGAAVVTFRTMRKDTDHVPMLGIHMLMFTLPFHSFPCKPIPSACSQYRFSTRLFT